MGDPELRSDEKVLVRTPGVYVKSIPFEGILTNKRIILIDRAKNLLPPKEIPLVTIKDTETGENAIRDQIITLSVMAKTGETRQMILTFSRQAGGNRIKERDAWARLIKENASSSYDQVIRKVIPSPESAIRRTELAAAPRYEVVHSPLRQPVVAPGQNPPAGTAGDTSPVRRPASATPVPAAPQEHPAETPVPGPVAFCSKCGNRVPAESVFCNRCGTPIVPAGSPQVQRPPVPAPAQAPPVPVYTPPVARTVSSRPIDEEIRSIEPLIERSTEKVPPDPLRASPVEPSLKESLSWDDEEKTETAAAPAGEVPRSEPAGKDYLPRLFSAKSPEAAVPAPVPSYDEPGETPPPPKPPRDRSFMPGKKTILTAAAALVVLALVAAGALFIVPMLTSGGAGNVTPAPTSGSSTILPSGTIVVKETPAPVIPATGVYVHVNYLGGFKGSYGLPDAVTNVPGNSGDRIWEVENATNSSVQATFEKLDGSSHELLVEIYRDGKSLSSGTTTVGHGSVTLSVDMVTGVAAAPITSGGSGAGAQRAAAAPVTTEVTVTDTAAAPAPETTAESTTATTTATTTASP